MSPTPATSVGARIDKIIDVYNRWAARASWGLSMVAAILTLAIAGLLVTDLIARTVYGQPLVGIYEAVRAALVAVVFFAIAYAEHTGTHVRVETLTERLRGRAQSTVRVISLTMAFGVAVAFTAATYSRAVTSTAINEIVQGLVRFPVWPFRWLIVLGFALLALVLLGKVADNVRIVIRGADAERDSSVEGA